MNPVYAFKALSDESRLRIFTLLLNHELNVNEIVNVLDMGQSRISRHLKILSDSGLLNYRRDGLWSFYSTPLNGKMQNFIKGISGILNECEWKQSDSKKAENIIEERTQQTKKLFNSLASDWEKIKIDILGNIDLNKQIISAIDKCTIAADLGCGIGDLVLMLKEKAARVIGVDNSPKMLEKARKYINKYINKHIVDKSSQQGTVFEDKEFDFRIGELEHLPLRDLEADCVIINMVLHHLYYPLAGLIEANRVLKKSGTLLVADLTKHKNENMRTKYGDRWLGFVPDELENWFLQAGFTIKKKREFSLKKELQLFLYILVKE